MKLNKWQVPRNGEATDKSEQEIRMRDLQITLSDGRVLAYSEIGERDWPCLVFFHGAPISRLHLAYLEEIGSSTRGFASFRRIVPD